MRAAGGVGRCSTDVRSRAAPLGGQQGVAECVCRGESCCGVWGCPTT